MSFNTFPPPSPPTSSIHLHRNACSPHTHGHPNYHPKPPFSSSFSSSSTHIPCPIPCNLPISHSLLFIQNQGTPNSCTRGPPPHPQNPSKKIHQNKCLGNKKSKRKEKSHKVGPHQSLLTTLKLLLGFNKTPIKLGSWPVIKSSVLEFAVLFPPTGAKTPVGKGGTSATPLLLLR